LPVRVLFRVSFYNVCFRLSTGIEEGERGWVRLRHLTGPSKTPGGSDEGSDQETDRLSPDAGLCSSMERHVGRRDELPARGRGDSPCRFFFCHTLASLRKIRMRNRPELPVQVFIPSRKAMRTRIA